MKKLLIIILLILTYSIIAEPSYKCTRKNNKIVHGCPDNYFCPSGPRAIGGGGPLTPEEIELECMRIY